MSATATAPAGRRCASSCSSSTATSAVSSPCSIEACRLCGCADRRSWRARHSRAPALQGVADAARSIPALTPKTVGEAVTRQTGIAGPILANIGVIRRPLSRSAPEGRGPAAGARRRVRNLSRASPGRGGILQGRDRGNSGADRRSRQMVGDPARPRLVRPGAVGRPLCRAQAAHHADRRHHRPMSRRTAARGITTGACRSCSGGRACRGSTVEEAVETVDIMPTLAGDDRAWRRAGLGRRPLPRRRSAFACRHAKHLKTHAFLSSPFRHEGAGVSWGRARAPAGGMFGCGNGVLRSPLRSACR